MNVSMRFAAVAVASLAIVGQARADFIIANASFEDDILGDGEFTPMASGWTVEGNAGTYNPLLGDYPGGIPDGVNVATTTDGTLSQLLNRTLEEGVLYVATVDVGRRVGGGFALGKLQLRAGGEILAETFVPEEIASGTFETISVQFMADEGHEQIGQQLQIVLEGREGTIDWDNVTLVPTPGAAVLLAMAGGIAGTRRRRR